MFEAIEATALLRAVLRDNCGTDELAREYLSAAERLGVDPLDYCAHRFGLGNAIVWQRAAAWARVQFATATPSKLAPPLIDRLEFLGEIRSFRQQVLGQDIA